MPYTTQQASLGLLLGLACIVLWGLTSPVSRLPSWTQTHDKLWHLVAFALLAILSALSWPRAHPLHLWLILVLAGFLSEVIQHLTPHRRFCWRDGLANAIGAALGLSVVALILRLT